MSEQWRLLGPQEAVSGTLAFGWSTEVRGRHFREPSRKTRDSRAPLNETGYLELALGLPKREREGGE
jgi:hypothetical protein